MYFPDHCNHCGWQKTKEDPRESFQHSCVGELNRRVKLLEDLVKELYTTKQDK